MSGKVVGGVQIKKFHCIECYWKWPSFELVLVKKKVVKIGKIYFKSSHENIKSVYSEEKIIGKLTNKLLLIIKLTIKFEWIFISIETDFLFN